MDFKDQRLLGNTGLKVGRLGVACSYGAPTAAFEEAFDHGVNYFYWGSRRMRAMTHAIRNIVAVGKRDDLVIVMQSYSRSAALMESFFNRGLKQLGLDHADILLLGWHNRSPSGRILERALDMRKKGMFRYLAISGHNRPLFPKLASDNIYDIFHIRYNAAHRGAETEVFPQMTDPTGPGIVTYTATRWGHLLKAKKMPPGETPLRATDCYRFALSHPAVDICMTGPANHGQMREALKALELGPLSQSEMERVRRVGDHVHAMGKRAFF